MFWKAVWRLMKQSVIACIISLAYAGWVYISKGTNAHATDAVCRI